MIFPQQLTIQLRKRQLQDIYGNNIIYTGPNPLSLAATIATEDTTWHDFTDFVDGLQNVNLTFSTERTDDGDISVGNFAPKKGVSGTLTFERDAYEFLKNHLVNNVAATLNQVEVQITDTSCGKYTGYIIKSTQLSWCEFDALCTFEVTLKQIDDYTKCIERTLIADNWQGWFQDEPDGGKKHPRFSYCVEKRPNWAIVVEWMLTSIVALLYTIIYTVFWPILLIIYALQVVIFNLIDFINTVLIGAINAIISIVGGSPIDPIPNPTPTPPATPGDVIAGWANLMIEGAGCGREHPAPLVRDYISNVCDRCGIRYDATTADIFFAPFLTLTHSDGEEHTEANPYYNVCYFDPEVVRGVRRFRKLNLLSGYADADTTTFYQPSNAPVKTGADLFNDLNKHFNSQWRITHVAGIPTLFFKRKDWYKNQPPIYDFSNGGADRVKIIEGICYTPQDITVPAACGKLYIQDPSDKCGDEAKNFYNGDAISFNNTTINPIFSGLLDKSSGFAPAKFNCDGASTNYLYDALQVCYSMSALSLILSPILSAVADLVEQYANYAVLLQTEQVSAPKLLIWDGDTDNPGAPNFLNAHAMRDKVNIAGAVQTIGHSGWPGTVPGIDIPEINTLYPSQAPGPTVLPPGWTPSTIPAPLAWSGATPTPVHQPKTNVIGTLITGLVPDGVYGVIDFFGSVVHPAAAILVNYPMYFEPHYRGTLWDWFHWIDDPYRYPYLNKDFRLKIPLCCEDLKKLKMLDGATGIELLSTVLLDTPYYDYGIITELTAGYEIGGGQEHDAVTGQYIEIKGRV